MAKLIARVIAWALTLKPVRAFLLYSEHRGPMLADSVTYRALFSVFAGVLLGFSIAGLVLSGNPELLTALVTSVDAAIEKPRRTPANTLKRARYVTLSASMGPRCSL